MTRDRVGLGWRPQLAAGILTNLDRIDIVEVIADDYFDAPKERVRSLRTLMSQVPLTLHGIGIGPSSTAGIDPKRVARYARLVEAVQPESWSEHLAWVRAGKREIGHLAAPCRNGSTVDATLANLDQMARVVGSPPMVENIASLVDPPASPLSEWHWLRAVCDGSRSNLLLDLHNVHTNSFNFSFDPYAFLDGIPLDRVSAIHIAGGRMDGARVLDDHRHPVPDPVYRMLEYVASRAPGPLTVILERDGDYPSMEDLLAQLDQARAALARGRANPATPDPLPQPVPVANGGPITNPAIEAFLAEVFLEDRMRQEYLADPRSRALRSGLSAEAADALAAIDSVGVTMASRSFARKRAGLLTAGH